MSKMSIRNFIAIICIILSVMLIVCACGQDPAETTSETTASTTAPSVEEPTESETESNDKLTYTVTVVDESNAPLAGATVQLCTNVCLEPVTTDENGVATITVSKADYTVKVTLDRYEPAETTFAEGETSVTVVLTKIAGETTDSDTATTESESSESDSSESESSESESSESESSESETVPAPVQGESAENPIFVEFTMNDESTEGTATVTVPAGKTYYFASYNVSEGMILTANGENVDVVFGSMMMRVPSTFTITNSTDAAVEYTLAVSYAPGSMMNPAPLAIGENDINVEANSQGYFLTYTATEYCAFNFEIAETCTNWTYVINNVTSYVYGETRSSNDESPVSSDSVLLAKGDTIEINIGTADWTAGEVKFTASTTAMGTEDAPFFVDSKYINLPVEAGKTLYVQGMFAEMVMTLTAENATVVCDGNTLTATEGVFTYTFPASMGRPMPSVMAITNNAETDATYTVTFAYPEGHSENPETAVEGENTVTVPESSQGYFFTYTAEKYCTLTLSIPETCTNWSYAIHNITSSTYGDTYSSTDEYPVTETTIDLNKGDEIQIIVGTADWTEGEISFNITTTQLGDSEENPYYAMDNEFSVELDMNETMYVAGYFSGMTATIKGYNIKVTFNGTEYTPDDNGLITFDVPASAGLGRPMPTIIAVTNTNEFWYSVVSFSFNWPAGHMDNPAELVIGENSADIAANSQGYYLTYTATAAGTLTITMPADAQWMYVINNLTAGIYGDNQWSDSDPVVNPGTVTVAEGDQIQIMVNTYNPESMWETPAGTITFTAAFEAATESEG